VEREVQPGSGDESTKTSLRHYEKKNRVGWWDCRGRGDKKRLGVWFNLSGNNNADLKRFIAMACLWGVWQGADVDEGQEGIPHSGISRKKISRGGGGP